MNLTQLTNSKLQMTEAKLRRLNMRLGRLPDVGEIPKHVLAVSETVRALAGRVDAQQHEIDSLRAEIRKSA